MGLTYSSVVRAGPDEAFARHSVQGTSSAAVSLRRCLTRHQSGTGPAPDKGPKQQTGGSA